MKSIISTDVKGNTANQSDVITRREEDNHVMSSPIQNLTGNTTTQIKAGNVTTCKTDANSQKQEHGTNVQSGNKKFI